MPDLFLVRHAQSLNNALGESRRQPDPALTELGQQQAERLSGTLEKLEAQRFHVSAFRRALETAAPFAARTQTAFDIWRDIHEVGGCYEGRTGEPRRGVPGLTPSCIRQEFQWARPDEDWIDGGWNQLAEHESVEMAMPRVQRVASKLTRQLEVSNESLLLVSHGEFISLLLGRLLGLGQPFFVRPRSIYNTAIAHLKFNSDGFQLHEFNRVCHLSRHELSS